MEKNIANSAGNLCLHLIGTLNAFIGTELGKTGYIRHRDAEFSTKNVPRAELVKQVDDTIQMVETSLSQLKAEQLNDDYPIIVFEKTMSTGYFLVHLATHLDYHLGQVNYHRRLLDF